MARPRRRRGAEVLAGREAHKRAAGGEGLGDAAAKVGVAGGAGVLGTYPYQACLLL